MVLDTNVCLDLLRFLDPATASLARALATGAVEAVSDRDCRDEWLRVLGYPQLALGESDRERLSTGYDAWFRPLPDAAPTPPVPLPRCADPDDQKFLQLAQRAGARWLLSRDRALLQLTRRVQRDHGFAIVTPSQWTPPA